MRQKTTLFAPKFVVIKAEIAGFYKSIGKKFDLCKHVYCGYIKPPRTECNLRPDDLIRIPKNDWRGNEREKHKSKGCINMWCVIEHGKQHEIEDKKAKCARRYYHLYTEQELANPKTQVEYVALELIITSRYSHYFGVAVYDLINNEWHNDDWWSTTPKGDLMPCQSPPGATPREVYGIEDIVAKAKVEL